VTAAATGPLAGLRVVELASMGPGPFCAMLLADLGADVIRVDRAHGAFLPGPNFDFRVEVLNRGRTSVAVDLKHPEGRDVVLDLVERADVLIEGYRAGVTERLGVGPDACMARNPRLVYGRMTGYGQDGPLAGVAGHDINYVAQSGMLSLIGRRGHPPTPPLSLVGDFGGGGMVLALGIVSAVLEARTSGRGQVVDAAMTDGAALLGTGFYGFRQTGAWTQERGTNLVDSGAPFYDAYETAEGRYLAVGAIEPKFYAELLDLLELDPDRLPAQDDQSRWPELKQVIADRIRTRTRDQWMAANAGRSTCVSPVLGLDEAPNDDHNVVRGTFVEVEGITQPAPAPRFSRTGTAVRRPPPLPGEHTREKLADWGIAQAKVAAWEQAGAIRQHTDEDPVAPVPQEQSTFPSSTRSTA
jgi:alpha-methylacyl-CoA racemase